MTNQQTISIGLYTIIRESRIVGTDSTEFNQYTIKWTKEATSLRISETMRMYEVPNIGMFDRDNLDKFLSKIGVVTMTEIEDAFSKQDYPEEKSHIIEGRAPFAPADKHNEWLRNGYEFQQFEEEVTDRGSIEYGPVMDYQPAYDMYIRDVGSDEMCHIIYVTESGHITDDYLPVGHE